MAKLYIMQTGQTTWQEQARFESPAGSPLTAQGARFVEDAIEELTQCGIGAIYAAAGEAEKQTAGLAAKRLGVKVRTNRELHEIDYGLWQGLTQEEIRRRNPKVYRQWTEAPATVCPPDGETLCDAQKRILYAMNGILKRHKTGPALLVLRPFVLGLLRCVLQGQELEALWKNVDPSFTWSSYEINGEMV